MIRQFNAAGTGFTMGEGDGYGYPNMVVRNFVFYMSA